METCFFPYTQFFSDTLIISQQQLNFFGCLLWCPGPRLPFSAGVTSVLWVVPACGWSLSFWMDYAHFPHGGSEYFQVFGRQRRALNSVHQVGSLLYWHINYLLETQNIFLLVAGHGWEEESCTPAFSLQTLALLLCLSKPLGIRQCAAFILIFKREKASYGFEQTCFYSRFKAFLLWLPCHASDCSPFFSAWMIVY